MRAGIILSAAAFILLASPWSAPRATVRNAGPRYSPFGNPEMVQILGYNDNQGNRSDAMEPFISRDGSILFFNNSNSAPNTELFWATRVNNATTFQFQGQILGVNVPGLNAVPSMDSDGNFFFITTRSYFSAGTAGYLSTIYSGPFSDGSVAQVAPVSGVAAPQLGQVVFDDEISADGNTLYFTIGYFNGGNVPTKTTMEVANRSGNGFVVAPNSARIMAHINNRLLNYAADVSADELEFFFTRTNLKKGPAIYMATRKSVNKPFGHVRRIKAITGFAEAPSISPDGLSLYYHWRNPDGIFEIHRVTRTIRQ
jgi:Tol biopolymer transport system component